MRCLSHWTVHHRLLQTKSLCFCNEAETLACFTPTLESLMTWNFGRLYRIWNQLARWSHTTSWKSSGTGQYLCWQTHFCRWWTSLLDCPSCSTKTHPPNCRTSSSNSKGTSLRIKRFAELCRSDVFFRSHPWLAHLLRDPCSTRTSWTRLTTGYEVWSGFTALAPAPSSSWWWQS